MGRVLLLRMLHSQHVTLSWTNKQERHHDLNVIAELESALAPQ